MGGGIGKPLEGQLSLLDEPPVCYCRRCRRLLTSERSRRERLGPTCRRMEDLETTKNTNHTKGDAGDGDCKSKT